MMDPNGALGWPTTRPTIQPRPSSGPRFDWLIVLLSAWMVGGLHLDAWAHHRFDVETFFTPWHGVLYSGFLALAAVLLGTFVLNLTKGYLWQSAAPAGYDGALIGVAVFMLGGVGDMLWHTLFGIEVNVEALLSPTHLLLALGGVLLVSGPLRSAWGRPGPQVGWAALASLALLLTVFAFFTAYANPLSEAALAQGSRPATEDEVFMAQGLGIAGILIQTALMMGLILMAVRRWTLPFGGLTLLVGVSTLLTVSVHQHFYLLPLAVIAGLAADGLLKWWQPSSARLRAFRVFAFAVPIIFYALYFATLALSGGVWWTIHLWAGAIVLAGIAGWLMSYAFSPPTLPAAQA